VIVFSSSVIAGRFKFKRATYKLHGILLSYLQHSFSLLITFLCEHHSSWTPFTYSIGKLQTERVRKKKTLDKQKEFWKQRTCVALASRSTAMNHGRILHTLLCEYFYIPLQSLRHTAKLRFRHGTPEQMDVNGLEIIELLCGTAHVQERESKTNTGENICSHQAVQQRQI
jgi:hypothetical protein